MTRDYLPAIEIEIRKLELELVRLRTAHTLMLKTRAQLSYAAHVRRSKGERRTIVEILRDLTSDIAR